MQGLQGSPDSSEMKEDKHSCSPHGRRLLKPQCQIASLTLSSESSFLQATHFLKEEMNLLIFIPHFWITYRSHLELNINTVHHCRPCCKWRVSHPSRLQTLNVR